MLNNILEEVIKCYYCGMTIVSPPVDYGFPPVCNEDNCDYRAKIKIVYEQS
jgi:hypothetical protein